MNITVDNIFEAIPGSQQWKIRHIKNDYLVGFYSGKIFDTIRGSYTKQDLLGLIELFKKLDEKGDPPE